MSLEAKNYDPALMQGAQLATDNILVDTLLAADIAAGAIGTSELDALAVTIPKLEAALLKGIVTVAMSFEANLATATKIFFPFKVTINKIRGIVMKAIAGTDNGTITGHNGTGDSASGVITSVASDALNVEYAVSPTTNNVVAADGHYRLTSAKSTAGGTVLVTLEFTRTA